MKWRVIPAVVFVVLLFAGFAYLYVNTFVRKHQHAVILFVINGLDLNTLNLARQQLGRNGLRALPDDPVINDARRNAAYRSDVLNLDAFWDIALLNIQDPGQPVPDEGADATAIACGQRVDNGNVGALQSLIYAAEQAQRATGLVTTSSLVQPTPVAFYSTTKGTPAPYRNAVDLVYSNIDIVMGGGEQYFTPATATNEWGRPDGRNLIDDAKDRGYAVVRTREELDRISPWRTRQMFGIFAPDSFYFSALQPEQSRQPSLAAMTRAAISSLNYNINGYFLVVTDGLVGRASEQNLGKLAVNEVAEVDEAIQSAIEYAGSDALVVVTNSYSLGAVSPTAPPLLPADLAAANDPAAKGADPKTNSVPVIPPATQAWLAGPGGPATTPAEAQWLQQHYDEGWFSTNAPGMLQPQPAFRFQPQASPLADPAWMASRGEGSSELRGFLHNTDVFDLVSEQF
jgi:alkaline phosphatase